MRQQGPQCRAALALAAALLPSAAPFDVRGVDAYTTHDLNDVTTGVQLHDINATPAAFGDFNSDQYTDMVVVGPGRDSVRVLLWDHAEHAFTEGPSVGGGVDNVVNVVASDFDHDGRLDLLLMRVPPGEDRCTMLTYVPGYTTSLGEPVDLAPAYGQPLVLNADADLSADLFGEACERDGPLRGRGPRAFWLNDGKGGFERREAWLGSRPLAGVPSAAAVDLDGDCRVDLVVPTVDGEGRVHLEAWLAKGAGLSAHTRPAAEGAERPTEEALPKPARVVRLPEGVEQLTWSDFDGDGAQDAVAPVCEGGACRVNATARAGASSLALVTSKRVMHSGRRRVLLCQGDADFTLEVGEIPLEGVPPELRVFASSRGRSPLPMPPLVRAGDFDLDGYPDLIAGLEDEDGQPHVAILRNRKGQAFEAMSWRTNADGSIVVAADGGSTGGGSTRGAFSAAMFDVDETGNLDLLLLTGTESSPAVRLYRNAFSSDDYFLKVMALNGECLRWCGAPGDDPQPPPYGVNQHGVTYMFASTSATGAKRAYAGTQLGMSAHAPLLTPYVLFGLGRTNDYVNEFWVGLPLEHRRRFAAGIIPNSQLIAIPSPPDKPSRWTVELYISKASLLPWVALALSAGLLVIGVVIIFIEWQERREDAREKKAMAPSLPL